MPTELTDMQVEEISAVDTPASPGAMMTFWKRDFSAEEGKAMPDGSFPIANVTDLRNAIQAFGRADNKSEVADHIARRARALDAGGELPEEGKLADMIGKSTNQETVMDPEELEKRLESLEQVAKAGPAEARYMADKELDVDAKAEFMGKSAEDRASVLKEAGYTEEADEVAKSDIPEELRKKYEDLEKRARDAEEIAKAEREQREFDNLCKSVEADYPNVKGDTATKAKILKALGNGDLAEQAKEIFKAADEAFATMFKEQGATSSEDDNAPSAKLNKMAQEKAASEGVNFHKAYADVLATPEGERLYNEMEAR